MKKIDEANKEDGVDAIVYAEDFNITEVVENIQTNNELLISIDTLCEQILEELKR